MSNGREDSLPTRPSLLARLKNWNEQTAWREFSDDYAPLVRNVARKAGLSAVEADEVVQETMIAVASKIADFEHAGNRGSFRNWLYQQTRWRIADQFRQRDKARMPRSDHKAQNDEHMSDVSELTESDPAFSEMWEAEWLAHLRQIATARVKRQVSPRQFQLFELHEIQGLSVTAAARAAGASVAATYMAKSRVSRIWRRELERLLAAEK